MSRRPRRYFSPARKLFAPLSFAVVARATRQGGASHEGTGDQFYDVEQFEAYRQLGVHVASAAPAGTGRAGTRRARVAEAVSMAESAV